MSININIYLQYPSKIKLRMHPANQFEQNFTSFYIPCKSVLEINILHLNQIHGKNYDTNIFKQSTSYKCILFSQSVCLYMYIGELATKGTITTYILLARESGRIMNFDMQITDLSIYSLGT